MLVSTIYLVNGTQYVVYEDTYVKQSMFFDGRRLCILGNFAGVNQ